MGYLLVWALIVIALYAIHASRVRGDNKLSRSPILPQAGAGSPRLPAPAPVSATDPSDAPDGNQYSVAVPARSGASVAVLSDRELAQMRINREAVERLYSVKVRGPVREEIAFRVIDGDAA